MCAAKIDTYIGAEESLWGAPRVFLTVHPPIHYMHFSTIMLIVVLLLWWEVVVVVVAAVVVVVNSSWSYIQMASAAYNALCKLTRRANFSNRTQIQIHMRAYFFRRLFVINTHGRLSTQHGHIHLFRAALVGSTSSDPSSWTKGKTFGQATVSRIEWNNFIVIRSGNPKDFN